VILFFYSLRRVEDKEATFCFYNTRNLATSVEPFSFCLRRLAVGRVVNSLSWEKRYVSNTVYWRCWGYSRIGYCFFFI